MPLHAYKQATEQMALLRERVVALEVYVLNLREADHVHTGTSEKMGVALASIGQSLAQVYHSLGTLETKVKGIAQEKERGSRSAIQIEISMPALLRIIAGITIILGVFLGKITLQEAKALLGGMH